MCRLESGRWLPTSAMLAALLLAPSAFLAQTPTQTAEAGGATLQPASLPIPQPAPEALGDALMAHHRYQAAIEAYKQAPQNSATVWNKMGIANQMLFNLPEATRCYQASLKIDPKNVNVLNNLGTDLLAQHKYEKGWEVYKSALAIDPQIFDRSSGPRVENPASVEQRGAMNYYMAKGCVRAGKTDRAIEYLRMALNEGFTNPKKIAADSEFAGLHGIPAFEQLISEQTTQ